MQAIRIYCHLSPKVYVNFKECDKYKSNQRALRASQPPWSERVRPKKAVQYFKPTVEEFDEKYYLISSDIWLLGGVLMMLTPEEAQELPVIICWKGDPCHFRSNEKETIELLCQIISDMNMMQNPKFVSFPLGKYVNGFSWVFYRVCFFFFVIRTLIVLFFLNSL